MIEFKEGEYIVVVRKSHTKSNSSLVFFSNGTDKGSHTVRIDKDLYHLLQQAMPHIGAIVEGE